MSKHANPGWRTTTRRSQHANSAVTRGHIFAHWQTGDRTAGPQKCRHKLNISDLPLDPVLDDRQMIQNGTVFCNATRVVKNANEFPDSSLPRVTTYLDLQLSPQRFISTKYHQVEIRMLLRKNRPIAVCEHYFCVLFFRLIHRVFPGSSSHSTSWFPIRGDDPGSFLKKQEKSGGKARCWAEQTKKIVRTGKYH